eukprot:s1130_g25.t1
MHQRRIDLLEVMCTDQSELTKQVNQLGGRAQRFGINQGDLRTKEGRMKLFGLMISTRPKNIWYSPECFPWCLWNQYNETRSTELWEKIYEKRKQSLWQISLGIVLHRYQVAENSHFHHEQPSGSRMKTVPGMEEIIENTFCTRFDLCQVGNLKDPQTGEAVRKRLEVHTTSEHVHRSLSNQLCLGLHVHRPIAGQTVVDGQRIALSKFTERYPAKFARHVAKLLVKSLGLPVFGVDDDDHPTKKRRLSQKMDVATIAQRFQSVNWQTVMSLADRLAPRVGTMVVDNGLLMQHVQQMCPNQLVKHIVLCRGTDRCVGPNKTMFPGEAPLRKMACIRRKIEDVQVETEWELWEKLTLKGLRRKSWPARVSLTVFAQARPLPQEPVMPSADARTSKKVLASQS